jgi:hypothetical protein
VPNTKRKSMASTFSIIFSLEQTNKLILSPGESFSRGTRIARSRMKRDVKKTSDRVGSKSFGYLWVCREAPRGNKAGLAHITRNNSLKQELFRTHINPREKSTPEFVGCGESRICAQQLSLSSSFTFQCRSCASGRFCAGGS